MNNLASCVLDVLSMLSLALAPLVANVKESGGQLRSLKNSLFGAWGGGALRDIALCCLLGGYVHFAVFHSPFCWLGVALAWTIFFGLKIVHKEELLDTPLIKWCLTITDGCFSARFLVFGGKKCIENGLYTESVVLILSCTTAIGGGLLGLATSQTKNKLRALKKRAVPYSLWAFVSVVYYQIAKTGNDGTPLTVIIMLFGAIIGAFNGLISEEAVEKPARIKKGPSFSFKIGLVLSKAKRFHLSKNREKGVRTLRQICTIRGCLALEIL